HAHAARDTAFRVSAFPDSAGMLIYQLANRHAERQLDAAGFVDMAADAIKFGPITAHVTRVFGIGRYAHRLKPIRAPVNNVRHTSHCLDVVHNRRLAESSFHGRERRLDPRPGAFPFQAFDQSRLLATDISAGTSVEIDIEVKSLAEEVLSKQAASIRLVNGCLQGTKSSPVFIANINVRLPGTGGVAGDDDSF